MKFKIGDRVEGIGHVGWYNTTGTIKTIDNDILLNIGVEWDKKINSGHDIDGSCKDGYGWFVSEKDIKLLTNNNTKLQKPNSSHVCTVLDQFINDRRIFTKYDVTKQLRHNGFMAIHREIRKMVDDEMCLPDDYDISNLKSFGNPELYIPEEKSLIDYDPNGIPEFDINAPKVTPVQQPKTTKKVPSTKSLFDVRDRYSVKAVVTRQAGFDVGDEVIITRPNKTKKIFISYPYFDYTDKNHIRATVDCYYNIRIPKKVFVNAFGSVPLSIDVVARKNIIEIVEN